MDYKQVKEQMTMLKEQAKKQAEEFFNQGAKNLFSENPDLESFSWHQYTPYFNDGDPCVFSVHTDDVYVNGVNEYGDTLDGDEEEEANKELLNKVSSFLQVFDDEDLLHLFGDHVSITATKEGIEKTEYNHD